MRSNRLIKWMGLFLLISILNISLSNNIYCESITNNQVNKNYIQTSYCPHNFQNWIVENYSLISNFKNSFWGWEYNLDIKDNFAYIAVYNEGLVIVNITDPATPRIVSIYKQDKIKDVKVSGNYAYIVNGHYPGFEIIDIFNPLNPYKVGENLKTNYFGLWIDGPIAYLVSEINGLRILNVSNPTQPIEIARIGAGQSNSESIFVKDKLVFTGEADGGMNIYDCSDAYHPKKIGEYIDESYNTRDIFVANSFTYLLGSYGITIVNIEDISNPVFHYRLAINSLQQIVIKDNLLFAASFQLGVKIYEINSAGYPEYLSIYHENGLRSLYLDEDTLYILYDDYDKHSLDIVDVSDPVNPKRISSLITDRINDLEFRGSNGFLLDDKYNILVYDFETISNPEFITEFSAFGETYDIEIWGSTIFYFYTTFLYAIDITDIENPISYSYLSESIGSNDFKIRDQLIFVLNTQEQLIVLRYTDITVTYNAEIISELELDPEFINTYEIIVDGNYAYILGRNGDYNGRLQIVDISNPELPFIRSSYQFADHINSIIVVNNILYAAGTNSLFLISLLNHDFPVLLNEYQYTINGYNGDVSVHVNENIVYLVTEDSGLEVVNVSNPMNLEKIGLFYMGDETSIADAELYDNEFICYLTGWNGINIIGKDKDSDGLSDILEENYESNPLNNDTDNDLLSDGLEVHSLLSNPLLNDSDFDNISDTDEVFIYNTNPSLNDTDHDLISDFFEIMNGTDPLNPNDPIWQYTTTNSVNLYFPLGEIFLVLVIYITRKKIKRARKI